MNYMTSIVQIPQMYMFSYIIVWMWTGSDCTMAKEVYSLMTKGAMKAEWTFHLAKFGKYMMWKCLWYSHWADADLL